MKKKQTAVSNINNPRVFIIQQPRPKADGWVPNFESATKYGTLHFVYDLSDRAYADPHQASVKAQTKLADFNPIRDYILPTVFGDPATTWVVIQVLARRCDQLKYLYWSRTRDENGVMSNEVGYYYEVIIPTIT